MLLAGIFLSVYGLDDVLAIEDAHQAIDSRNVGKKFGLVTLHETPGNHNAFTAAGRFLRDGLADGLQGLGPRSFEKSAGIYDDGIGLGGVGGDGQAILRQQSEHALAVHKVLGATETYKRDRSYFLCRTGHHLSKGESVRVHRCLDKVKRCVDSPGS
jgi:hypothetical protein